MSFHLRSTCTVYFFLLLRNFQLSYILTLVTVCPSPPCGTAAAVSTKLVWAGSSIFTRFTLAFIFIYKQCIFTFKVTVYLQGCFACKRCSACSLSCRYLNPYIKLKLYIELAIKLHEEFSNKMNCRIITTTKCERPNHLSKATSQSKFRFLPI